MDVGSASSKKIIFPTLPNVRIFNASTIPSSTKLLRITNRIPNVILAILCIFIYPISDSDYLLGNYSPNSPIFL